MSTKGCAFGSRGGSVIIVFSGISFVKATPAATSVIHEMIIIKNEDKGWGIPKKNVANTGMSSDQHPAAIWYPMTFRKLAKMRRPSLTPSTTAAKSSFTRTMAAGERGRGRGKIRGGIRLEGKNTKMENKGY